MSDQLGFEFLDNSRGLRVAEWIAHIGDDHAAEALNDPFDIRRGLPLRNEMQSLANFFPRLSRGVRTKDARTLQMVRGNEKNVYAPDFVLRYLDADEDEVEAIVDVERKTRDQLFLSGDLPVNVPVLTMRAHRGETEYTWPDGSWRYCGKMRFFRAHPTRTFFLAVSPDATHGLLVRGSDIIEREPEWIRAAGPFKDGKILVVRVPRCRAILGRANQTTIENAFMTAVCAEQDTDVLA